MKGKAKKTVSRSPKLSSGMQVMNEVLGGRFGPLPDYFKKKGPLKGKNKKK